MVRVYSTASQAISLKARTPKRSERKCLADGSWGLTLY
jgi:hypothetical protein